MPKKIKAVVLAAGLGTRMNSKIPKVLHPINGKPMINHVLDALKRSGVNDIICVLGHKAALVKKSVGSAKVIIQARPLGSGDALNRAKKSLSGFKGDMLVLCGDTPLIRPETLKRIVSEHRRGGNFCTLLSTAMPNPTGYGRVVRSDRGIILKITEETEASVYEKAIEEINVGAYCFSGTGAFSLLNEIKNNNAKKEYFLTDIISLMHKKNMKIGSISTEDNEEALGVNSRKDLAVAGKILRKRVIAEFMEAGVTVVDPDTTYIDEDTEIGADTIIYPNTVIEGGVKIGGNCSIGPFARIRPGCSLEEGVAIGNFVELVRTKIGRASRVKHHTYLGDTIVGRCVNIGAGTITANYDGNKKYITKIDDGAFIGCGTILVAPVKIGRNAVTGAGAVVTRNHDVPPNSVAIGVPARRLIKKRKRGA